MEGDCGYTRPRTFSFAIVVSVWKICGENTGSEYEVYSMKVFSSGRCNPLFSGERSLKSRTDIHAPQFS